MVIIHSSRPEGSVRCCFGIEGRERVEKPVNRRLVHPFLSANALSYHGQAFVVGEFIEGGGCGRLFFSLALGLWLRLDRLVKCRHRFFEAVDVEAGPLDPRRIFEQHFLVRLPTVFSESQLA